MTVASAFNKLAPDWDAMFGPGSANARRHADRIAYLRALCMRRRPERVLEIGCATGLNLVGIGDLVGEALGVDCSSAMIDHANKRADSRLRFLACDALALSPRDHGRFDIVMFAGTLEHIEDQAAALRGARAMLAPGGCLLTIMPHPWQPRQILSGAPRIDGERIGTWLLSPRRLQMAAATEGLVLHALWSLTPMVGGGWRQLSLGRTGSLGAAFGQAYAAELCLPSAEAERLASRVPADALAG